MVYYKRRYQKTKKELTIYFTLVWASSLRLTLKLVPCHVGLNCGIIKKENVMVVCISFISNESELRSWKLFSIKKKQDYAHAIHALLPSIVMGLFLVAKYFQGIASLTTTMSASRR